MSLLTSTPEARSRNMAAIRGKDTKPEVLVRKYLWTHGFRYRLNHPALPGKPDIVLRKYRTCIFVNGCFWHGHKVGLMQLRSGLNSLSGLNSECCKIPKTNRDFWLTKIIRNKERDIKVQHKIAEMGWHCITIWECELKPACRKETLMALVNTLCKIYLQDHQSRKYLVPEEDVLLVAEEEG